MPFTLHLIYFPSDLISFVTHVTGKLTVSKKSVQVDFLDDSEAITAHTCSNLIVLPRTAAKVSYEEFCGALTAVISGSSLSFNIV